MDRVELKLSEAICSSSWKASSASPSPSPTSEDLDLFTAAMSAGGLLLELIVGRVENLG